MPRLKQAQIVFILILALLLISFPSSAESSSWIQTDWSGGSGEGTTTEYQTATNINDSAPGQIELNMISGWTFPNWKYRQAITVSNSDAAQTNYPVLITVNFNTHMNADFSDLRFTNSSGTELGFWLEEYTDSSQAHVWVNIDALLETGDTAIYVYYGNETAVSSSDGESTFEFFDNFSAEDIDTEKWTEGNIQDDFTIENGELVVGPGGNGWSQSLYTTEAFERSNLSFEFDYRWTSNNPSHDAMMMGWKDDTTGVSYTNFVYAYYNPGSGTCTTNCVDYVYEDGSGRGGAAGEWTQNTQYKVRVSMLTGGGAYYEQSNDGGETWITAYTSIYSSESSLHPGITLHTGEHRFDNVRVRKWMDSEPESSFGSEEERFESEGTLTSNILDTGEDGSYWGSLSYSIDDSGEVLVKVRSDTDPDMASAQDFSECTAIDDEDLLSDNDCVTHSHRYIQYQLILNSEEADSPTVYEVELAYDSLAIEANAGLDTIVAAGRSVTLNGAESVGIELSYLWGIFSGDGTLSNATTATPTYTASADAVSGEINLSLTVFDDFGQRATDTVTITVVGQASVERSATNVVGYASGNLFSEAYQVDGDGVSRLVLSGNGFSFLLPVGVTKYSFDIGSQGTVALGVSEYEASQGCVFVFTDPVDDISGNYDLSSGGSGVWTKLTGRQTGDEFGKYVVVIDLENDGEDEIHISAPGSEDYGVLYTYASSLEIDGMMRGEADFNIGSVLKGGLLDTSTQDVVLGPDNESLSSNLILANGDEINSSSGIVLISGDTDFSGVSQPSLLTDILVEGSSSYRGMAVGDVNNDNENDLIVATDNAELYIYFGGLETGVDLDDADADVEIAGGDVEDAFGNSLIIGDGINDVVIGAPDAGEDFTGAVTIIFGSTVWENTLNLTSSNNVMVVTGTYADDTIGTDLVLADADENGVNEIYTLTSDEEIFFIDLTGELDPAVDNVSGSESSEDSFDSEVLDEEGFDDYDTGTSICGNGILDPDESCDDGNTEDGDACSADCATETESMEQEAGLDSQAVSGGCALTHGPQTEKNGLILMLSLLLVLSCLLRRKKSFSSKI